MNEVLDQDRPAQGRLTAQSQRASIRIVPDHASRFEPFPLTDVQRAYWLGRGDYFELGNVGCHLYVELTRPGLDRGRLQAGWQKLIERHGMLRAVIGEDGLQRILPHVPHYEMQHLSLTESDQAKMNVELEAIRRRMSHQVFRSNQWPLFELCTSEQNGQTVLHFSMDLLFVDVWSIQILLDELLQLAFDPSADLPPLAISFRDYVLATRQRHDAASYSRSEAYWLQRLDTLPPAPKLPLAKSPGTIKRPRFVRRKAVLEQELWEKLKARSARANMTPSGTLMTAFARVLAAWSESPHFTVNTTLLQRDLVHPDVARLVGDFTGLLLLEVREDPRDSFEVLARRIAAQFRSDLKHRQYGGLRVLQEIARRGDAARPPLMPVVFTGAVTQKMPGWKLADTLKIAYEVSQTPQVYLDYQVVQRAGCLELAWDAVEELFPPGLLDDMFGAYCGYLRRLAEDEVAWRETNTNLLPPHQLALRAAANDTAAPISTRLLHEPFLEQVRIRPDHPAVITAERRLSYRDVHRQSRRLARQLRATGVVGPNRLVAVVMEKGWEQVVAAIAILEAGAAYLPVDPDWPRERRWLVLERGGVEIVLTQPCVAERLEWPTGVRCVPVDWQEAGPEEDDRPASPPQCSEDLAYVIFTSGSTGEPKGVMIEHRSALNTILDINERFGIGAEDRILALSSLSFDLSVYDIFGALAAGATIVLPHPTSSHEPGDWAYLALQENVTIWNSVPALLELLVDHVGSRKELPGHSLRLALLSGDWIPVGLPDRARALLPRLQVVSLGGATEASIWSIFYPIGPVGQDWKSIPYGRALKNQRMHVLNHAMNPCPTWVPGQIHIGGIGLARGYWRDEAKTQAQFVSHPQTGERLYRTGDLGRYLPDGNIEFLGREDDQVKVQGYRIELGGIEAALERHPKVKSAVVRVAGERVGPKHLVASVVADAVTDEELAEYLRQKLPAYMVPAVWQKLDALPLTANGKVNRKALPDPVIRTDPRPAAPAHADALARMAALIAEELALPSIDPRQNLLTLGATSMDLVRIVGRLQKELNFRPSFQQFLRNPSAAALAELYRQSSTAASPPSAIAWAAPRPNVTLILDSTAKEAFRRENRGIRAFPTDWGRLRLEKAARPNRIEERISRRRAVRRFRSEPVPLASLGALLAELSRMTTEDGGLKYAYGSAGGLYPVQTYLHAKPDGILGLPSGTFYYHPVEHSLVPIVLGAELNPEIHEPFTNRPIFQQARFSLFFVHQPRAIEPIYGDLAWRFAVLEAGAMGHALETAAWRLGLGLCPIGWLDFAPVRGLLQLEDGQELLHAHVGGLADTVREAGDWEEGVV